MRRIIGGVILLVCSVAAWVPAQAPRTIEGAKIGRPAPPFTLSGLDGKRFDLAAKLPDPVSKRSGRMIVLVWWSATSPAVAKADPVIGRLATRYRADAVDFIGVNPFGCTGGDRLGAECVAAMRSFKRLRGLDFPMLIDEHRTVTRRYRVRRVPAAVVIDRAGIVRYRGAIQTIAPRRGAMKTIPDLANAIDEVLSGKPVTRPEVIGRGTLIPYPENPTLSQPAKS